MDMDDGNGSEYLLLVEKFTMAEEKKETAEEVKEPNILEQLREEREKGEKVLAEFKELKMQEILSGKAEVSEPEKPKEMTAKEYAEIISRGIIPPK